MAKRILLVPGLLALALSLSSCSSYSKGEAIIAFPNFLKNTGYVDGTYVGKNNGKIAIRISYGKAAGSVKLFPANQVMPDEKGAGVVMQRRRLAALISQRLFVNRGKASVAMAPDAISPDTIKSVSKQAKRLGINGWVLIMTAYDNCRAFGHKVNHTHLDDPAGLLKGDLMDTQLPLYRKLSKTFNDAGVVPANNAYIALKASVLCNGDIFKVMGERFDKKHPEIWFKKLMKAQDAYRKYLIALSSIFPGLKRDTMISDEIAPNGDQYAAKRFSSSLLAHNLAKEMDSWYKDGHRTMAQFTKKEDKLVSTVPSANKAALVQGIDSYMQRPILALKAKQAEIDSRHKRG